MRTDPVKWFKALACVASLYVVVKLYHSCSGQGAFSGFHRVTEDDVALKASATVPSPPAGREICRAHGWRPYRPKAPGERRKVYDLIMINTELDWLEIRLNTTYDYVDYFVIVEARKTFTGLDKPLIIKDNLRRFAAYHDKIIYHELQYPPEFKAARPWDREDLQRDATFTQVFPRLVGAQTPALGDALVVADVDEIPRPETLTMLRHCDFPRRLTLRSRFYYYSFQFLHHDKEWAHPQATYYDGARTVHPTNLRNGDGGFPPFIYWDKADLWNAAWHCSSCFETMDELLTKMKSFSHVWMNDPFYREANRIVEYVRGGKDLWDRESEQYDRISDNKDVPSFLLTDPKRFQYLLDRDGPSAGFTDYTG